MQNKPTKRIATGWVVCAIGGVMLSLGSAAAADPGAGGSGSTDHGLSAKDRCAIVKLQATSREAKCLADAHIRGIRQGLSDEEVNELSAVCTERKDRRFENAEDDDVESACGTIGVAKQDPDLIDNALILAIETPESCDNDTFEPCDYSTEENQAALSTMTLRNNTPNRVPSAFVRYIPVPLFCSGDSQSLGGINPGQIKSNTAGACLVTKVWATMLVPPPHDPTDQPFYINCDEYVSFPIGTGYRTFQVVMTGPVSCAVNRP